MTPSVAWQDLLRLPEAGELAHSTQFLRHGHASHPRRRCNHGHQYRKTQGLGQEVEGPHPRWWSAPVAMAMTEGEVSEAVHGHPAPITADPVSRSGQRVGHLGALQRIRFGDVTSARPSLPRPRVRSIVGHDYTRVKTPSNGPSIQSARNAGPFSSTPRFRCSAITLQVCVASGTATTSTRLTNATPWPHLNQDLLTKGFKTAQLQEIEEANRAAVLDAFNAPNPRTNPTPPSFFKGTGPDASGRVGQHLQNGPVELMVDQTHCTPCPKSFQATLIHSRSGCRRPTWWGLSSCNTGSEIRRRPRLQHPPIKKLSSWAAPWA